jgi:hypothetical protein
MTEEGLPPTFCSILIFTTYAHPASLLLMLLHYCSRFTGELVHFSCCDTPAVTPHHGIVARYPTMTYFRRLSTSNNLLALNSLSV